MNESKVTGTVHLVEDTKTYGQKGFRKRLVVLEQNDGRFPTYIPVEFLQDACDQADALTVGSEVEITYRLNGRKWQRDSESEVKYFLSCEAINFKVLGEAAAGSPSGNANDQFAEAAYEDDDEVPF